MSEPTVLLERLHKSLNILRERQAKYGLNAPISLIHEIEDHQMAITLTKQLIASRLTESDWRKQLQPLLVSIEERQATEIIITLNVGGVNFNDIKSSTIITDYVKTNINTSGDLLGRDKASPTVYGSSIDQVSRSGGTLEANSTVGDDTKINQNSNHGPGPERFSWWPWIVGMGIIIGIVAGMIQIVGFSLRDVWEYQGEFEVEGSVPDKLYGELYDDFNSPEYDGSFNPRLWVFSNPHRVCDFKQQAGVLVLKGSQAPSISEGCFLNGPDITSQEGHDLFSVKVKALDSFQGYFASLSIIFISNNFPANGWASCSLEVRPTTVHGHFEITSTKPDGSVERPVVGEDVQAEFNEWYNLRFVVDPDTMKFSCYLDDELVGAAVPEGTPQPARISFERYLQPYFNTETSAIILIDEARIGP